MAHVVSTVKVQCTSVHIYIYICVCVYNIKKIRQALAVFQVDALVHVAPDNTKFANHFFYQILLCLKGFHRYIRETLGMD